MKQITENEYPKIEYYYSKPHNPQPINSPIENSTRSRKTKPA